MRLSDTLILGPIGPVLSRPLRLRVGVLLAVFGVAAAAGVAVVLGVLDPGPQISAFVPAFAQPSNPHEAAAPQVEVVSQPAGATIPLGQRELGRTPATVSVLRGAILTLRRAGFLDTFARWRHPVSTSLCGAQTEVHVIRPPVPGAAISAADFLPDGRVALAVQVPPTGERQPWAYDPDGVRTNRLGGSGVPGTLPNTVAPAGLHTAAIVHLDGLDGAAADHLSFDGPDVVQEPLSSLQPDKSERLLDVSWSPTTKGVVLLSQRSIGSGKRFRLRFVSTAGEVSDLTEFPVQPVVGSWVWASDGRAVGFLVQARTSALVTLDITTGEVRYLDDLRGDALPSSGGIAPATWQTTGWLLYAAPCRGRPRAVHQAKARRARHPG